MPHCRNNIPLTWIDNWQQFALEFSFEPKPSYNDHISQISSEQHSKYETLVWEYRYLYWFTPYCHLCWPIFTQDHENWFLFGGELFINVHHRPGTCCYCTVVCLPLFLLAILYSCIHSEIWKTQHIDLSLTVKQLVTWGTFVQNHSNFAYR